MFRTSEQFKKKFKITSLTSAPKTTTPLESVCIDAVYHHVTNGSNVGPTVQDLTVNAVLTYDDKATIYVYLNPTLEPLPDNRKLIAGRVNEVITKYHKVNRRLSRVLNLERILSKKAYVVVSYDLVNVLTKRVLPKPTYVYDEHAGVLDLINNGIKAIKTDRMHILQVRIPQILPAQEDVFKLVTKSTPALRKPLRSFEEVMFVETVIALLTGEGHLDAITSTPNLVVTFQDGLNLTHVNVAAFKEAVGSLSDRQVLNWVYDIADNLTSMRISNTLVMEETEELVEGKEVKLVVVPESPPEPQQLEKVSEAALKPLLERGVITEQELSKHLVTAATYKKLPNPVGKGTLEDLVKEKATQTSKFVPTPLPDMVGVVPGRLSSARHQLDAEYITKHLETDLVNTLAGVQQGPFAVVGITKESIRDAGNNSTVFKLQTKALKGGVGTVVAEIPVVNPEGTFQMGGVDYRMAVQRVNFPIAKIGPSEIAMSANSKMFLTCGELKSTDYPLWLNNQIFGLGASEVITNLKESKNHGIPISTDLDIPSSFVSIGESYSEFNYQGYKFSFKAEQVPNAVNGLIPCGVGPDGALWLDMNNVVHTGDINDLTEVGSIPSILGLNETKAPKMFAELKFKGKKIPVMVILAYWLGITKALRLLKFKYRIGTVTDRAQPGEYAITFSDARLFVEVKSEFDKLMVYGWHAFKDELLDLRVSDLDLTANYSAIFTPKGITRSHEIEMDIMRQYWISFNVAQLLKSRNYPTQMVELLIHCVRMLTNRQHYMETDGAIMIERGYSRLNDILHGEIVNGIRDFHRNTNPNRKLTINPEAVRLAIAMDDSVSPVERVNPYGVMGEQDRIVYSGTQGRSNLSLVGRHRVYHNNDRGRISEAYTDDGKAGTVMYYSANPAIENYYGVPVANPELKPENLLSFNYMLNPFLTFDDGKRGNYARIQNNAVRASNGSVIPPVMTNAGLAVAHRAGSLYAFVSKQDGVVTSVSKDEVEVKYKDGSTETYGLGLRFGGAAGKTYPRSLITDREKGYKFTAGEVLAWDDYYLFRDRYNTTQTNMYNGVWDLVAFRERAGTYEDASRMSTASASKTASDIVHIRPIPVTFDSNLKMNVKVGDVIDQDKPLAYITPPGVSIESSDEAVSLDYFSAASPKAKYDGKVVRIEVFYMGDPELANINLKEVIKASNKERKLRSNSEDISPTGEYRKETYIQKERLNKNSAVILVYILHEEVTVAGDKVANANSLKTVPGKIYDNLYTLEDGTPVDSDFSYKGLKARITPGAEMLGLLALYIRQVGLNAAKAYRNS